MTLEGKVLIPDVGELKVDGLLLAEAQDRIRAKVLSAFRGVEVSVTLASLRQFQVHVLGQVANPGTYLATAVDRVSAAVAWAGGFRNTAGQRRLQVFSGDELRTTADLFLFLQRGDRDSNPQLADGDVILVPYVEDRISVLGAVNNPGPLEFVDGDRFSSALRLAGGFTSEVSVDTVEVARYIKGETDPLRFFVTSNGEMGRESPAENGDLPEVLGEFVPPRFGSPTVIGPAIPTSASNPGTSFSCGGYPQVGGSVWWRSRVRCGFRASIP